MKASVGLIPGIIREELKQDLWGTLAKLAELGYKGIEGSTLLEGDLTENRKRLDALGLKMISIGASRQALENDLEGLIGDAESLGADHIVIFWGPCESKEQLLRDAEFYNRVGQKVSAHGMKFCYHNHDHEFKTIFDGMRSLDILMQNTDPASVYFEVDVAWVRYGGTDPVEHLKQHAERVPVIHLKDIADINERGAFTAVGTGIVNVRSVVETCLGLAIKWVVVEQDRPRNLTPMESVTASILNLREMGLA